MLMLNAREEWDEKLGNIIHIGELNEVKGVLNKYIAQQSYCNMPDENLWKIRELRHEAPRITRLPPKYRVGHTITAIFPDSWYRFGYFDSIQKANFSVHDCFVLLGSTQNVSKARKWRHYTRTTYMLVESSWFQTMRSARVLRFPISLLLTLTPRQKSCNAFRHGAYRETKLKTQ